MGRRVRGAVASPPPGSSRCHTCRGRAVRGRGNSSRDRPCAASPSSGGSGRHRRQRLTELVREGLLVGAVGRHLVRLVDDHEVPAAAEQALFGVLDARDPGDGRDDLVLLLPRVLAVVGVPR